MGWIFGWKGCIIGVIVKGKIYEVSSRHETQS